MGRNLKSRWPVRRIYYAAALTLLSAAVLFIAGKLLIKEPGSANEEVISEPIFLHLWYPWTDEEGIYKKAFLDSVAEYNENHQDIQILPEGIETKLYREKLPSAIASNDTPDIYLCYTNAYLKNIVNSEKVLCLNDYLDNEMEDEILPGLLEEVSVEGEIYGLGFAKDTGVFFVNNEMFGEYGCDIPQNWEELLHVCQVFLDNGIVPLACSADADRGFRMYLEALCMSEAGAEECLEIISGRKNPTDEFLKGVVHFCELRDMGAFGRTPSQNTTGAVEEEFNLSRIPMYYAKNRIAGNILQRNSPLYGKMSAVPFPGTGNTCILGGVSEAFVVNRDVKHPKEAAAALKELSFHLSVKLTESSAGIPVWIFEEQEKEEDTGLYDDIREMDAQAKEIMPYWEFYLGGKKSENFMKISGELYRKEISAEEFVRSLSR